MLLRRPSPYESRSLLDAARRMLSLPNILTADAWHSFRGLLLG
jgi:hypothetical protein